jgi:glycosyltransferase involved in cell wall biosynthesis
MKIALVTNLPSHFHTRTFEMIAQHYDTHFLFFSDRSERGIESKNELKFGNYRGTYVHGIRLSSRLRINTQLLSHLLRGNYDLIIQSINGRFELLASFLTAKLSRKPFLLWTNLWFHPQTVFHKVSFPITKYIYKHSDAVITYGYHVRNYLVALGVDENQIFYSWNVVDNSVFNSQVPTETLEKLRTIYHLHGRRVILFVGRHIKEKGISYLMEAYKSLPAELNASLLTIGRGNEKEPLMRYVEKHELRHVHFVDYVPNKELISFYALADVFVLPSITTKTFKEPWGLVLNEAMNQGCPVIATTAVGAAVGGLVEEGKSGFVVPERNSEALRDAIVRLLADPQKLREMKAYARKAIQEWDHHKSFKGFKQAIEYVTKSAQKR